MALSAEDRERLRTLTEEQWTAAALTRDWDKLLAMCAPDIVYMPADQPALPGHSALQAWLDQFPRIVKFTQPLEQVEGQGDLAVGRATFAITVEVAGKPVENTGKVLFWCQKEASSRWLVKAVCWNWDRPMVPAP
jgi:ketosteroid isomerase-like protein